jgi:hypothetical protein
MLFRYVAIILVALVFGGCATDPGMKQLVQSHHDKPIKVLLSEVPLNIEQSRLQAVFMPDKKSQSKTAISSGTEHAQSYAFSQMQKMLEKQTSFTMISVPVAAKGNVDNILKSDLDHPLSQIDADAIHEATGADALLRFRITDYGLTPKSWRDGYIAFEVTSTLAIAGAIAYTGSTAAHAAAGGYLAQETVEETTEAYAGFWGLDVVTRPVRLETELIRLHPVQTIWETDETGMSDIKLSRLTRSVPVSERDMQLDQSMNHAVNDISADLQNSISELE